MSLERMRALRAAWPSRVPEGEREPWRVERFEVSDGVQLWQLGARAPSTGAVHTRLLRRRAPGIAWDSGWCVTTVMSDTPAEYRDHSGYAHALVSLAARRVLIHGLGIGCALNLALACDTVEQVDVVELSPELLTLVSPVFADDPRVRFHQGDAHDFRFPRGSTWDVAWHDIWDNISGDNLESMTRLKRRYGRAVRWQGCWSEPLVRRL